MRKLTNNILKVVTLLAVIIFAFCVIGMIWHDFNIWAKIGATDAVVLFSITIIDKLMNE